MSGDLRGGPTHVAAKAILSDIHANLEALDAVLEDIRGQGIDTVYCLGDIIGYGPNPCQCVDRCLDFKLCLLGNHDHGALFDPEGFSSGAERAIFWTRGQMENPDDPLNKPRWHFLAQLPRTRIEDDTMYVHGSPRNPLNEYVFPEDVFNERKIKRIFGYIQHYCFQGHTHVPGIFTEDGRFFKPDDVGHVFTLGPQKAMINVGSVGQPRDSDPRSCYVVVDGPRVLFRRVSYDTARTREKIHAIPELDNFLGDRLQEGR
jgi:predicted phosphodiesterase